MAFAYGAITRSGSAFQPLLLAIRFVTLGPVLAAWPRKQDSPIDIGYSCLVIWISQPLFNFRLLAYPPEVNQTETEKVWAIPDSLATTTGIVITFLSSRY